MQRKLIRFFGTVVSLTGALFGGARVAGAATATTAPTGPSTSETTPTVYCPMVGQPSQAIDNCSPVSGEVYVASGSYYIQQWNCSSGTAQYSGHGQTLGRYNNPCVPITNPSGTNIGIDEFCRLGGWDSTTTGRCNDNSLVCYSSTPFLYAGCCESGSGSSCTPTNSCYFTSDGGTTYTQYSFSQCASGYYKAGNLGFQYASTPDGILSLYSGCCLPCSGIKITDGQVITYENSSVSNSGNGFYWVADQTSYGLESCTAYPSTDKITGTGHDDSGAFEFTISGDCPYN